MGCKLRQWYVCLVQCYHERLLDILKRVEWKSKWTFFFALKNKGDNVIICQVLDFKN